MLQMPQGRTEVGLHESLLFIQQSRTVQMVALIVDPAKRCLLINGELPMLEHKSVGCCTQEGVLPFVTKLVGQKLCLRPRRVYQNAKVYDPFKTPQRGATLYIVARVDVAESLAVSGGEWAATAERVRTICSGDEFFLKCIQLFLGDYLAWKGSTKHSS